MSGVAAARKELGTVYSGGRGTQAGYEAAAYGDGGPRATRSAYWSHATAPTIGRDLRHELGPRTPHGSEQGC